MFPSWSASAMTFKLNVLSESSHIVVLNCLHAPEGDKYKVARKWGYIYIVTRKWFDQSIARRGNALLLV